MCITVIVGKSLTPQLTEAVGNYMQVATELPADITLAAMAASNTKNENAWLSFGCIDILTGYYY